MRLPHHRPRHVAFALSMAFLCSSSHFAAAQVTATAAPSGDGLKASDYAVREARLAARLDA
jgi:hypothetical protein